MSTELYEESGLTKEENEELSQLQETLIKLNLKKVWIEKASELGKYFPDRNAEEDLLEVKGELEKAEAREKELEAKAELSKKTKKWVI